MDPRDDRRRRSPAGDKTPRDDPRADPRAGVPADEAVRGGTPFDEPVFRSPFGAGAADPFGPGFFSRFGFPPSLVREMERMQEEMSTFMRRAIAEAEKGRRTGEPFVYGFSMKMGPDGLPQVQHFGNASSKLGLAGVDAPREPLTDVIEGDGEIAVTVELPGVSKDDVSLHVAEDKVTIRVDAPRKYYKQIPLPARVLPKSAKATFKNGVLDLALRRGDERRDPGEKIRIE